jgi:hypothetical protein
VAGSGRPSRRSPGREGDKTEVDTVRAQPISGPALLLVCTRQAPPGLAGRLPASSSIPRGGVAGMNSAFRAGLLVGVVVATALPAHAVTLVTWYDAPSLSGYSDGAAVGTLPDLSASGNAGNGGTPCLTSSIPTGRVASRPVVLIVADQAVERRARWPAPALCCHLLDQRQRELPIVLNVAHHWPKHTTKSTSPSKMASTRSVRPPWPQPGRAGLPPSPFGPSSYTTAPSMFPR